MFFRSSRGSEGVDPEASLNANQRRLKIATEKQPICELDVVESVAVSLGRSLSVAKWELRQDGDA